MRVRLDIDSIFSAGGDTFCGAATGGAVLTGVACVAVAITGMFVLLTGVMLGSGILRGGFGCFSGRGGGLDADASNEISRIR